MVNIFASLAFRLIHAELIYAFQFQTCLTYFISLNANQLTDTFQHVKIIMRVKCRGCTALGSFFLPENVACKTLIAQCIN